MAVDMGGPVNKAAYVFGTGTLAATVSSGGSVAMAAVMAGGMVPPLAIFVATLLFKDKFTKEERNTGLTTSSWAYHLSLRERFHLVPLTQLVRSQASSLVQQ